MHETLHDCPNPAPPLFNLPPALLPFFKVSSPSSFHESVSRIVGAFLLDKHVLHVLFGPHNCCVNVIEQPLDTVVDANPQQSAAVRILPAIGEVDARPRPRAPEYPRLWGRLYGSCEFEFQRIEREGEGGGFEVALLRGRVRIQVSERKRTAVQSNPIQSSATHIHQRTYPLSLGRTHINSCDFSPKSYSFSSTPDDFDLTHFDSSVSHDQETMIPFMKRASDELSRSWDTDLKIIASPWSPPAWMKKVSN